MSGETRTGVMEQSGIAWGHGVGFRQGFGKAIADDVGGFGHEVHHFLPFIGQQVLLQLRMDRPLGFNLRSLATDQHAEQFHVPARVGRILA